MMRMGYRNVSFLLASLVVLALFLFLGGEPTNAQPPIQRHLELVPDPGKTLTNGIPGDCSTWHEIWPAYCIDHHQAGYEDNGDSLISPCDVITLDTGERWHVVWVGPTYWIECFPGLPPSGYEPTEPGTGDDPTGEIWHEVYPNFCESSPVEGWQDNGDGVVSACDLVMIGGVWCHIVDIGLNIIVEPDGGTSTEGTSWGDVKTKFRTLTD